MNILKGFIDIILHLDEYLTIIIQNYGLWTYLILFLIIFAETGLVITPFLPGDSILFAAGAFAAIGSLNIKLLLAIIIIAAILGDTINYSIGKTIGRKIYERENTRFIKKEYLIKTNNFYEKHGTATIIIARFIPIIRTFAPFVAGVGEMRYGKFISYNIIGGVVWSSLLLLVGYYFGNLSVVKENFTLVILAIMVISIMPAVYTFLKERLKKERNK